MTAPRVLLKVAPVATYEVNIIEEDSQWELLNGVKVPSALIFLEARSWPSS